MNRQRYHTEGRISRCGGKGHGSVRARLCVGGLFLSGLMGMLGAQARELSERGVIDAADLMRHTQALSSDAFEGRAPGSRGEELAVNYVSRAFAEMGLKPGGAGGSWFQRVPMVGVTSDVEFRLGGEALQKPQDYVAWSPRLEPEVTVDGSELVFVGYGVKAPEYGWDDFKGLDLKGRTLVMLVGDPPIPDPKDPSRLDEAMFKGVAMTYYGRWTYKFEEAARQGAAAAVIIHETKPAAYPWFVVVNSWSRERFELPDAPGPTVSVASWMSLERAQAMLKSRGLTYEDLKAAALKRDFQPRSLGIAASFRARQAMRRVESRNVAALIEGRDRRLRSEWIVYTAHWDHLGRNPELAGDQVFNGAADNAIGTAGLLELAQAYAKAPRRPRRSVLFLAVTAEEQGLLGARYYAQHPLFPLAKTLANLNIDGLNQWGRTRDISVVGHGQTTLVDVLEPLARGQGRVVVPEPNPERGLFYRSDHFEFANVGVPALYLKAGEEYLGKDPAYGRKRVEEYIDRDYHKVSDEVKPEWDLSGAVEDLRLLFGVGWSVAEGRTWPEWKPGSEFRERRLRMLGGR